MKHALAILALAALPAFAQTTCQTIGQTTICSDGRSFNHIGNVTIGSDGSTAQRIGGTTFINPGYTPPPQPIYSPPPAFYVPPPPRVRTCGYNANGFYVCQ